MTRWQAVACKLCAVALFAASAPASANIVSFYVGVDGRSAPFDASAADGGGAYPDNPNFNRLTLLFHHGDHYHGIGQYAYGGAAATPTLNDTNANNRLPETFNNFPPISLRRGAGATWSDTYRSGIPTSFAQDHEYGNFEIRSVHSLVGEDDVTFNSSGGRWTTLFDAADIHLQLVSATAGLHIAIANQLSALVAGGDVHLGAGNEFFSLLPTFWVDAAAAIGSRYSAEFRLLDRSGTFGDSGRFFVDFQVVPTPGSTALLLLGGALLLLGRRRL